MRPRVRDWRGSWRPQTSLELVLNWGRAQRPPIDIESILTQDEYTHDVLIPFEGRYLVYDTT